MRVGIRNRSLHLPSDPDAQLIHGMSAQREQRHVGIGPAVAVAHHDVGEPAAGVFGVGNRDTTGFLHGAGRRKLFSTPPASVIATPTAPASAT